MTRPSVKKIMVIGHGKDLMNTLNIYQIKIMPSTRCFRKAFSFGIFIGVFATLTACGSDKKNVEVNPKLDDENFTGNAWVAGPGGDEFDFWEYGEDGWPRISINRIDGLCTFDNGLVSVIDMNNARDEVWWALDSPRPSNESDDAAFPAYSFKCGESPYNDHRKVIDLVDDVEYIWTYSNVNDAMFYGNLVYDTYVKYLGEPPLDHKIRIRVHYGSQSSQYAFWDGSYANFSDAIPFYHSMLSLDSVAHEVGHGVLNRISKLNGFDSSLSTDARTLHEAFSDISALMAKYDYTGHTDNWVHSEKIYGVARHLDQIETEYDAIASLLDYDQAGDNYYLRIGMISYPFYLLVNEWGIETAYSVYVNAARNCWMPSTTLTEAAYCIQVEAGKQGLSEESVIAAFKAVKIKLFDEGVLSHFTTEENGLDVQFTDNSDSTSVVTGWLWDFGDGSQSIQADPSHTYATAGIYTVRLTVQDQSNDQDDFERTLDIRSP